MRKTTLLAGCCLLTTAALMASVSGAVAADCPEGFPSKPITILAGFGAGGGTDGIARLLAAQMEKQQGWTVVVENRPGASGSVMAQAILNGDADGHWIGMAGSDVVTFVPYEMKDAGYTYEDFDYLGSAMQIYFGLVTLADNPFSTLEEFVEYAREKGHATVSVAGVSQAIAIQQIAEHFGVNITPIPGEGSGDALNMALGGHVDAATQGSQHVAQIKEGNMKQLASMIDKRVDYAPDSKTLIESGVDASLESHTSFLVNKEVPDEIQTCLAQALDEAIQSPEYAELMVTFDNDALNLGPEGMIEMIERVSAVYKEEFGVE